MLAEKRIPACGRCDEVLENPEAPFCSPCLRREFEEYPLQFIDYFEAPERNKSNRANGLCPRGHRLTPQNTARRTCKTNCKACEDIVHLVYHYRKEKGGLKGNAKRSVLLREDDD